ncbi:hypothetical protein KKG83_05460 [Candidatus Micrarchaeota archaeon]|nr:hypothetical protein [Candidatus Micrarchaeota archaeon]
MSLYEQVLVELKRKGDSEKVRWLEGLNQRVTSSQKKRIQENDSNIMEELFAPKWVSWEVIYSWATKQDQKKNCILCSEEDALGIEFKGKFVCASCFIELKHKQ